jgi:cell division protein FtsB
MLRSNISRNLVTNAPTPEEIRKRAFEIHIERGGFHGCGLEDLLQAERELQQNHKNNEKLSQKNREVEKD